MVKTVADVLPADHSHDPPPPYTEHDNTSGQLVATAANSDGVTNGTTPLTLTRAGNIQPCVIPQTTVTIRGVRDDHFARAYPADFKIFDIDEEEFLAVIDGLNECFTPNPDLSPEGIIRQVLSAGASSVLVNGSFVSRPGPEELTRLYLRTINVEIFAPIGLHFDVLGTSDMVKVVDASKQDCLPPTLDGVCGPMTATKAAHELKSQCSEQSQEDGVRLKILHGLQGSLMPIDYVTARPNTGEPISLNFQGLRARRLRKIEERKLAHFEARLAKQARLSEKKGQRDESRLAKLEKVKFLHESALEKRLSKTKNGKEFDHVLAIFDKKTSLLADQIDKQAAANERNKEIRASKLKKALGQPHECQLPTVGDSKWIVITPLPNYTDGEIPHELDATQVSYELPAILRQHGISFQ